jgi:hypothetical protein
MTDTQIHAQYSTGLSRRSIERALIAAGKDLNGLEVADLGMATHERGVGVPSSRSFSTATCLGTGIGKPTGSIPVSRTSIHAAHRHLFSQRFSGVPNTCQISEFRPRH